MGRAPFRVKIFQGSNALCKVVFFAMTRGAGRVKKADARCYAALPPRLDTLRGLDSNRSQMIFRKKGARPWD
jgi:hypothetical protein